MAKTPYKMKGYTYPGASPLPNKKEEEEVKTTRTKNTITKSKGNRSSTYTMDESKTKKNKDGSVNYTFTNADGASITEVHSVRKTNNNQGNTLNQVNINQKTKKMTYLYYKTSSTGNLKPNETTIKHWKHLSEKKNWRITQLPNGFYQTECLNPDKKDQWQDVTRRETIEGAETAINGSVKHFADKLEATKGPKVIKTFEQSTI